MTDEITMLILLGYSIKCIGAGSSHPTTTFLTSGMAFQGSCGLGNNMCKQTEAPPLSLLMLPLQKILLTDSTLGEEELYILF
jgi:hypothetical protein